MLLPPTSPTLTLSDGATAVQAFDNASMERTDPAARTDDVFMNFLRDELISLIFLNAPKGKNNIVS